MDFIFEQVRVGGDRNFGYLIGSRKSKVGALVDPSFQPELLVDRAKAQGLKIAFILNTHGHHDHVNGNHKAKELTGAYLCAHPSGTGDFPLEDGQELTLGDLDLKIVFTPGHSPDHLVIYVPRFQLLLTGDHLFVGKVGGTEDGATAREQYDSLHNLFVEFPQTATIWPGHDYGCRPTSTLALEQATNPFVQAADFEAFYALKNSWPTFKTKHGLR